MNTRSNASSIPSRALCHHRLPNCLATNRSPTGVQRYFSFSVFSVQLYSKEETMYLEVTLPVIRPSLMVISDHGRDTVDFGDIVNGMTYSHCIH